MDKIEVRAALAGNIKGLRGRRNWSQADLAEKAGLSIVYLSDIERGNKWPYLDTLVKLAEALEVEVYELLMPENAVLVSTRTGSILVQYTKEATAILSKSLELAETHASQALINLRDRYLSQCD